MEELFATEGITESDRILHTPGSFARNNLLYVQEVGKLQSLVPHICKRENLDSFLIFEVLNGKGTVTYNQIQTELHKGDCIWIDCHNAFEHISSEEEPWQLAWVHFNGKCAKEFYELFLEKNKRSVFKMVDITGVQDKIDAIFKCVRENVSELKVHELLTELLVKCILIKNEKNILKEIREFINSCYKESKIIDIVLERYQISQVELEDMFEQNYGIGLREYIMKRRFNAAKEMLRFTILPIDDIIINSGIGNEDLFYQLFKENENMRPEEYRRNWAQWIKD